MSRILKLGALAFSLSAAGAASADVLLTGPDSNAGTYSAAALQSLASGTDTVSSGGVTGISLWGLLGGANASSATASSYGDITTSTPAGDNGKNSILRYYVLATGAGGAQAVVSLGGIDPNFGGTQATPSFLAYQSTGGSLLSAPELVTAQGTTLSGVTSLQLLSAPALPTGAGGVSTAVSLTGLVGNPGSYTAAALQGMPSPVTETVSGDTYTGVSLASFLDASGPAGNAVVVTQGTDGYEVVLSLAEVEADPADLLAYADTGGNFPSDGIARTILPSDNAHGRWMSNLDAIEVIAAVPEPSVVSIFGLGLLGVAVAAKRRAKDARGRASGRVDQRHRMHRKDR